MIFCLILMLANNTVWGLVSTKDLLHYLITSAVLIATPTFSPDTPLTTTLQLCQTSTILLLLFISMVVVHQLPSAVCAVNSICFGMKLTLAMVSC